MRKHHPYQNIIEKKLEQLPTVNADLLWDDMHSILDKKMPQEKKKRRFIFWFFTTNGFLWLTLGLLTVMGSLFFLSEKDHSVRAIKKINSFAESDNATESGTTKIPLENGGNKTVAKAINQTGNDNRPSTGVLSPEVENVSGNDLVTTTQPQKNTTTDLFSPSIPLISTDKADRVIAANNIKSVQQDIPGKLNGLKQKNLLPQQPEILINKNKSNTRNNSENGFYAGITSGIDLSSVHFRSVRQGVTKGLLFGYAFNRKWSIESGLLWDTKRVYDDGSYFNPPGYTAANGMKITAVNGKSRLTEWPINIKYTIIPGKHSLFATAGVSSYIMRTENYDYLYTQNNQPGGHNYLSYTNETKNWFSVVNFSLGYNHKLGNVGNIRVEPYIKLPVKNIGVGKMPIMSTGLNIEFTKTLR